MLKDDTVGTFMTCHIIFAMFSCHKCSYESLLTFPQPNNGPTQKMNAKLNMDQELQIYIYIFKHTHTHTDMFKQEFGKSSLY